MNRITAVFILCMVSGLLLAEETAAPLTAGQEIAVFADGPGKNYRGTPHVAFGRDKYLAVWREGWEGKNGGARIYAARISANGKVLDPNGIELAPNKDKDGPQEWPRVAFCKDTFLVVWQDLRSGTDYDILGMRVSQKGKLLDAEPIKIAAGPHHQALPDIASDGEGFLVVWQGYEEKDHKHHGYAVRVDVEGKVGEPAETGVAPQPRVAWDGKSFLVVGADAVKLDSGGKPAGKKFRITVRVGRYSLTGVPDKGWLLVTHRSPPDAWGWGGPGAELAYFVLSEGVMDSSMPKEAGYPQGKTKEANWLDMSGQGLWPYGPSAGAWEGKQTVVVWQRYHRAGAATLMNSDLVAVRTEGWKRLDEEPIPIAASEDEELEPALASDGTGHLLCLYEKESKGVVTICGRMITSR